MNIGKSLREMRERKGLSQANIASDMFVDQTYISKVELSQRTMSEEMVQKSVGMYSDAAYGFEVAREMAADYITPLVAANKAIEMHRLALEEVFKQQAAEAIEIFNQLSLVKNPAYVEEVEREQIACGIKELLDVQAVLNSFLVLLEQEYEISVKQCMRKRMPTWRAKGWI